MNNHQDSSDSKKIGQSTMYIMMVLTILLSMLSTVILQKLLVPNQIQRYSEERLAGVAKIAVVDLDKAILSIPLDGENTSIVAAEKAKVLKDTVEKLVESGYIVIEKSRLLGVPEYVLYGESE